MSSDVTVVVPVWDAYVADYLEEALTSVRTQVPQPRILVVDNASRVAVPASPHTEVVQTPERMSVGAARNYGLARVRSEFTVFWDADDIMPPDTLATLRDRIAGRPNVSIVAAPIVDGASLRRLHWPRRFTRPLARLPRLFAFIQCISSLVPTIGAMIRTETARAAGGFAALESGDDWVLGVSLTFRGRAELIRQVGRIYGHHTGSIWSTHQTIGHLLGHAKAVRERVADDPAAPSWLKRAQPLIAVAQWLVIFVLRPSARLMR